jgi:hypothetical protein
VIADPPALASPPPPAPAPAPGVPHAIAISDDSTTTASPELLGPPPAKRRLGKLELAIIIFLGFDLLIFAAWKLFIADHEPSVATKDPERAPSTDASAEPDAVEPVRAQAQDQATPKATPEPEPPASKPSSVSVEEALASEFPPEPATPGPTRPMAQSLSDKDFREAMVDARSDIVASCLDTRMRRTLKVSLKVAPNGEVSFARVVGGLSDTNLGRCVVKVVYHIEFPPTHEGGSHIYTLRLR